MLRVSSAHTQRVLTPTQEDARVSDKTRTRATQSQSGDSGPQSDKRVGRGPTAESGVRVPGGPAEEATGSSAARSSAALNSRRGDALASGAIGSPGCAGTERGWPTRRGPQREERRATPSVPVAGRPVSCASGAAARRRPLLATHRGRAPPLRPPAARSAF